MSPDDRTKSATAEPAGTTDAEVTKSRASKEGTFEAHKEQMPDRPTELSKPSWKAVLKRTMSEFMDDQGTDLAAALTYYSVLSLFPAVLALTSLLGVFGQGTETTQALLQVVADLGVSDDSLAPIRDYINSQQNAAGASLALLFGLLGALWAASNYVNAFSRAMNRIYEVEEGRPIWKLRPWTLLITLVLLICVALVGLSLVFTGPIAESVGSVIGLGDTAVMVWNIAKWPVMFAIVVLLVALLYWGTPNIKQPRIKWISAGAIVAIVVWVLATVAFGLYVANFGNYNKTYGALAGVILLLLWLWITNVALVFGGEFDAELERGRELHAGLPAEETIQLPPRDTKASDKKAEKQAKLFAESRKIRTEAAREHRANGSNSATGNGSDGPSGNRSG